jgi:hypothetical protein
MRLLLLLLLIAIPAHAQRQNNIWYFGKNAGLDFNGATPVPLQNGANNTTEGTASICDPRTGALLFYSDGNTVWDASHQPMPNGSGLYGHYSSTQSALIVPVPGSRSRYYLFTTDDASDPPTYGLNYSIVDMTRASGKGDVVVKNRPLVRPALEGQCGYYNCDRDEYWVVAHGMGDNLFYAYRVTTAGIGSPVITPIGRIRGGATGSVGALTFSPDGSMLASIDYSSCCFELFGFDRSTGLLHSPLVIPVGSIALGIYGACFSPDNSKLYVSTIGNGVVQYDVSSRDSSRIARSLTSVSTGQCGSMQLGPDGRIYIAAWDDLDRIEFPDRAGTACGYVEHAYTYSSALPYISFPNLVLSNTDLYRAAPSPPISICPGGSTKLSATGGTGYRWSPAAGLSCTDCQEPIAAPTRTTTYRVDILSRYGCPLRDSVTVTVAPARIDPIPDTSICLGDGVALTASDGAAWSWSPAGGLSCTDCRTPIARPDRSTLYTVVVTSTIGCSASDSVLVTVLPRPIAEIAGSDTTICPGESVRLSAAGGDRYRWSPAPGLSCIDCPDPVATPESTTTYHLTLFNSLGCSSTDSITITVDQIAVMIATSDTTVCRGTGVMLEATGVVTYRWSPADGLSCIDCATPVATPERSTTYFMTGITRNGCERMDSIRLTVIQPPTLALSGDSIICEGSTAYVMATGATTYRWSSSDIRIDCPTCATQVLTPTATTRLFLEGKNSEGCVTIDSFEIVVVGTLELSVSGEGDLCSGESRALRASGATSYQWTPADGLTCSDCPDPMASPEVTTTYRVIGTLRGGCSDTVSVTVTVHDAVHAIASLPRDQRLSVGQSRALTLRLDREITADTLLFDLGWRRGVIGLEGVRPAAALIADGWSEKVIEHGEKNYRSIFFRAAPGRVPAGDLIELSVRGYLGDSTASELPFTLAANGTCVMIESNPGSVTIDSICGLSIRLITYGEGMLRLDAPAPHPIIGQGIIRYAVPFDADQVALRLIDAAGHIRTLSGGYHAAGEYEVVLGASDIAPGMYVVRLNVGELVRQIEVLVVR